MTAFLLTCPVKADHAQLWTTKVQGQFPLVLYQFLCIRPNVVWRWPEATDVFTMSVRSSVRACVRPKTLLERYLVKYMTAFHQTHFNDAHGTDERKSEETNRDSI